MPGSSRRSGIGQGRLDPHHAGRRVDLRLDRGDLALEHLGRDRRRRAARPAAPTATEDAVLLGQGEVGVELVEVGQRHQRVAGADILAELDPAQAELAAERRLDQLLVDDRLAARDPGPRLLEGLLVLVDIGLGGEVAPRQLPGPLEIGDRQPLARLVAGEIGLLGRVVELHQRARRPRPRRRR